MNLTGDLLLGGKSQHGSDGALRAVNPTTGENIEPSFGGASIEEMQQACALAADAFDAFRELPLEDRASFLECIAENISNLGDSLIDRCMLESGLTRVQLERERARTLGQLRLFANVVRDGDFLNVRIDPAMPDREPMPRVDLRLRHIPVGPVAVFSASNFPFAFSVAGGDTASAFAAGCPVIVKAHPAHPGTSEMVGRAIQSAVHDCRLPEGVFSLIFTSGIEVAQALVADTRIAAVGFTGSRGGGTALMSVAASRPNPIPVYAEMSSINPVILLPGALSTRAAEIGRAFISSLTLGAGQFCTNPGLVLAVGENGLDAFLASAAEALRGVDAATMLTPGIHQAYNNAVEALAAHPDVELIGQGSRGSQYQGQATLFLSSAEAFLKDERLQAEIFGAASLVLRCRDKDELHAVLAHMEGQLTGAIQMAESDTEAARHLLPLLEKRVGRILVNGFGTGVEVSHAMVHGGPYPATSDGRTSSVGTLAIRRFLRPVSYQDLPEALLPQALKDANPLKLWRRLDGKITPP